MYTKVWPEFLIRFALFNTVAANALVYSIIADGICVLDAIVRFCYCLRNSNRVRVCWEPREQKISVAFEVR